MGYENDMMNAGLLGGGAQGFIKGIQDAEDHSMRQEDQRYRKMEMDAKLRSQSEDRDRQRMMDALAMRNANVIYDKGSGQFTDTRPTPQQQDQQTLSGMEKGIKTDWDPNSGRPKYSYDPKSPQSIGAQSKLIGADGKLQAIQHKHDIGPKDLAKLSDALDPNKARGGQLAKIQGVINSSDRIHGIFQQFPDGNIPKAQSTELVTAVAGLISGGSPQSQHQIDQMVPQSMAGNAQDMVAWVTNNPLGKEQQAFMRVLKETSERERTIAQQQKWDAQTARLPQFEYMSEHPQYQKILKAYGVSPDRPADYQSPPQQAPPRGMVNPGLFGKALGMIGLGGGQAAPAAPADNSPRPGEVHDGYEYIGGEPSDPKSWKKK